MAGEKSPEYECGQILFCLKMSNLNYLVKETPYSSYITIRKKFIKEPNNIQNSLTKLSGKEAEIDTLKEHSKDLETRLALAKLEFEEMEINKEKMTAEVTKLGDEIDDFLKNEKILNGEIRSITKERDDLKNILNKTSKENITDKNELTANVMMLENVVEARDLKIYNLVEKLNELEDNISLTQSSACTKCDSVSKEENNSNKHKNTDHVIDDDESQPSTSKCGKCEYESDDETDIKMHMQSEHALLCEECEFNIGSTMEMKIHMEKVHTLYCKFCNETFAGKKNKQIHVCRMHLVYTLNHCFFLPHQLIR